MSATRQLLMAYRAAAGGSPAALDGLLSGLWGAYGITKLRAGYAGSALRVRRSSDNAEQDIGFTGTALDTTALATFVGANSAFVSKLYDQSGSGHDFGNTNTARQPRIVNAGTYDGFLRFDGAAHRLVTTASAGTVPAISAATKYKYRSTGANMTLIEQTHTNTNGFNAFAYALQSSLMKAYAFTGLGQCENSFSTLPTADGVDLVVFDRAASGTSRVRRWRGGAEDSPASGNTAATPGNFTAETFSIGGDSSDAEWAALNLYTLAIWTVNQAANASAINTALA